MIRSLYTQIFIKYTTKSINIFLCGKKDDSKDTFRKQIKEDFSNNNDFNIVFAEKILTSLLANKKHDLLTLEGELAEDVDVIILPLESSGTFTELGAFASFEQLRDKLLVVNKNEFKNDPSFINLGPIRLLKNKNNKNVVYYEGDNLTDEIKKTIKHRIRAIHKNKKTVPSTQHRNLKNIFNLSRFLLFAIGLFQPVSNSQLMEEMKKLISIENTQLEKILETSKNILFENNEIRISIQGPPILYGLTEKGHNLFFDGILSNFKCTKEFCKMRLKNLYRQLKN